MFLRYFVLLVNWFYFIVRDVDGKGGGGGVWGYSYNDIGY